MLQKFEIKFEEKAEKIKQKLKKFDFEEEPVELDDCEKNKAEHKKELEDKEIMFEEKARKMGFLIEMLKDKVEFLEEFIKI